MTVVFLDKLSHQLVYVDKVHITLWPDSNIHRLSPGEFDLGHFMFGTMLDLTMAPSTCSITMIWRYVDADNHIHDFVIPPRDMLHFTFGAAVTRLLLIKACQATCASTGIGAHNYFYDYIGTLLYVDIS